MTGSISRPALAYLLRLWAEDDGGRWVWRASLTPIHTNRAPAEPPRGFPSLADAVTHLQAELARVESVSRGDGQCLAPDSGRIDSSKGDL